MWVLPTVSTPLDREVLMKKCFTLLKMSKLHILTIIHKFSKKEKNSFKKLVFSEKTFIELFKICYQVFEFEMEINYAVSFSNVFKTLSTI